MECKRSHVYFDRFVQIGDGNANPSEYQAAKKAMGERKTFSCPARTAEDDMRARALREAQVDAERLALATRSALAGDGDLLTPEERAAIEQHLAALDAARQGTDAGAVRNALDALADSTEAFAAARMNRSIRSALTGRRVEEV